MLGAHLIKSWSSSQPTIALSSGEAELYAIVKAASQAMELVSTLGGFGVEMNAIVQCARNGVTPLGGTIYTSFSPCVHCTLSIIQSGIVRVVTYSMNEGDEHWITNCAKSRELLSEAGIEFVELARA